MAEAQVKRDKKEEKRIEEQRVKVWREVKRDFSEGIFELMITKNRMLVETHRN